MDVNGNDNAPEWGWCTYPGCGEAAMPIWLSGEFPDDPDYLLCPQHIGSRLNAALVLLRACHMRLDALGSYGNMDKTIELTKRVAKYLQEMRMQP